MDGCRAAAFITMRLASIDIGTNTVLMLVADVQSNGSLHVVRDEHFIGRLGKGVDEHGIIQKETFQRILDILSQLKDIADSLGVKHLLACGTSALRDAENRQEFIDFMKESLALEIRILSGNEEAELTYLGAVSEYLSKADSTRYAVLDIGGGSTEIVVGSEALVTSSSSIDIGSVRLTERFLKISPPSSTALENAVQFVRDHLQNIFPLTPTTHILGVAGTLTTLAALDLRIPQFDRNLVNRHVITLETIDKIFQELRPLSLDQLRNYPQIHPSRADILLAGIIILREIMKKVHLSEITVSDRGLRYGIVIKTAQTLFSDSQ
ncbi:MAG: Ppx/GppA phosphatase family protein [Ignavibacteriales bacterium]|nr:Ppx/GppA phosphatase family protein [Ignavibacteriales bacterium]